MKENEIVLYQRDETVRLEVRIENETVWLNQAQMAVLFGTKRQAITKHIKNIFDCGELQKEATCSILELVRLEGSRNVTRQIEFYNLDVIISVGYRVNTMSGIHFRQWATSVLKERLLKGIRIDTRLAQMEERIDRRLSAHDKVLQSHEEKIDFFIRTNLPPVEGVLFEGQVLDARLFAIMLPKN
ncbi:MAG: virulence RhuM family protein [Bacteroidales bacterium]|nr:virulence RhuM family protein [Bacteroidales bacterium]